MAPQTAGPWLLEMLLGGGAPLLAHDAQIEDREFITLALGLVATLMAVRYRGQLASIPGFRWWFAALLLRVCAWTFTIIEEYVGPSLSDACNAVEHIATLTSTIFVAVGCWVLTRPGPEGANGA